MLDPAASPEDRLAAIAPDGPDDATTLLERIDDTAARAGMSADTSTITTRWHEDDVALVDARIVLGGTVAGVSGAVLLGPIELERVDGRWFMTAASLCGIARAGAALGVDVRCGAGPTFATTEGVAELREVLGGAGDEVTPGPSIPLGVWGDPILRTGDVLWYVDYPELRLGGGGPVGPAEIVAVDLDDQEIVQRVLLEGTDATLAPAGDDAVYVLHHVPGTEPGGLPTPFVARVDAGAGRGVDRQLPPGTTWIASGPDGVWVFELGRVGLLRDGAPAGSTEMVELPGPIDPAMSAPVDGELWVPVVAASPVATVIDGRDGSARQVDVPPGRLIGSAGRVWSVGVGDADAVVARLLRQDGSVERTVSLPHHLATASQDGSDTWGDGDGGIWVRGWLRPPAYDPSVSMTLPVSEPTVAFRLGADPAADRTVWAHGSSPSGPMWFRPVGGSLAVGLDGEVALVEP